MHGGEDTLEGLALRIETVVGDQTVLDHSQTDVEHSNTRL